MFTERKNPATDSATEENNDRGVKQSFKIERTRKGYTFGRKFIRFWNSEVKTFGIVEVAVENTDTERMWDVTRV